MRTTIDIPDDIYRALKIKAATEGTPLREIVLRGAKRELVEPMPRHKFEIPVIRSSRPGSLDLKNIDIDDILFSS